MGRILAFKATNGSRRAGSARALSREKPLTVVEEARDIEMLVSLAIRARIQELIEVRRRRALQFLSARVVPREEGAATTPAVRAEGEQGLRHAPPEGSGFAPTRLDEAALAADPSIARSPTSLSWNRPARKR